MSAKVRGTISRTNMGANGLELRFVMRSDPRYLQVVRGAVGSLAAAIGWDESDCMAITMALDEALANVIRHAYHNRRDGEVELVCRESAEGFEAILSDRGEAPDQSKICARKVGSDTQGGLGTHIIRDVMDTVTYEDSPAGNRLILTKRFQKTI
jgi:anti-sigma regulatory factor (Ser/Thr protein kinase)